MSQLFTIGWTPSASAVSQVVKWKQRSVSSWSTAPGLTAANPQTNTANSATLTSYTPNVVYQFQIDTICNGGNSSTEISEAVINAQVSVTVTPTGSGGVNVTSNPLPGINTIDYKVVNAQSATVATASVTGLAPQHAFTGIAAASGYHIQYRYNSVVNGNSVSSTDADQANAWYVSSSFTVT